MNRFAKSGLLSVVSALALAGCATTGTAPPAAPQLAADTLREGFVDPPMSARPRTWWHWMNGNVTQSGIAADLAWLASVGMGGVQTFDAALDTPQIVDQRLVYMTPGWRDAFAFADAEAERLGLELAIAASPGWSETGGPWVAPENGMKKLVWGETLLTGGARFAGQLTAPPGTTGPYQTAAFREEMAGLLDEAAVHGASGRVAVLAVPVLAGPVPTPAFTLADGTALDAGVLGDADLESGVRVPLTADLAGEVRATFVQAQTLRSMQVFFPGLKLPFRGVPISPVLEARIDGAWQLVRAIPLSAVPTTVSFMPVTAREFRLRIAATPPVDMSDLAGAPGALEIDIFALGDMSSVALTAASFSAEARTDRVEEKAGFQTVLDYHAITGVGDDATFAPAEVIDLTGRIAADGTLDWTPPAGRDWRVLSFGWSLTGKVNHPAPPEATGLEVDKFDAAAVRSYLETYLAMYDQTGATGIDALLTDSIEVGLANWTPRMEAEFASRRGYALRPWLPALTGVVIGSAAQTEAFLYDWRRTLGELLADAHYATVAQVAHENDLVVYGEALEDKRPLLGDDLDMRRHADVPMAALWAWQDGKTVRPTFLGDMRGAASVAHVYGRPYVAAESMTAANSPWAFAPRDLRRFIDLEFASGINRPVIHTSVHQPSDTLQPGLSLLIFGQYFNRHETWAGMARPWIDYLARSSYLLQQGTFHADIALFTGEEAPLTAQFANGVPAGLPREYAFDFVNAAMLADAMQVDQGMLVSAGGTRYRALQLAGSSRLMTLPTLRRIAELASAGATIIGLRPDRSPSLGDDAAEFARLADATWALPNVIARQDAAAVLAGLGLGPDFAYSGASAGAEVLFVHRHLGDGGEIYFVNNRSPRPQQIEARFRTAGRAPELWDAITGSARPLSYRVEGDVTVVPLDLGPEDAKFVVFREPTPAASRTVAAPVETVVTSLAGPWSVAFQAGRGAPASITMPALAPLNEHADFGVRHFSGVSTWSTSFALPTIPAGRLWLDLGTVADVAEVRINGQAAGITWWSPDRVEIGSLVRPGINTLEVRVANLWVNRLIGDRQAGAEPVTFTAAPTYRSDAPLRPAGLIGPVSVISSN
jgi:hypothetical protein